MNNPLSFSRERNHGSFKTRSQSNAHIATVQQCDDCSSWVFYPRNHCSHCLSPNLTWKTVSGEGEVYSFTIARSPTAPQFAGEEPQYIAVIELNEGIRLNSVLTEVNEADIKVGMKVVPVFHRERDATLLYFKPAS